MAQDSLGKKTHLPCTLYLFSNAEKIWDPFEPIPPIPAIKILSDNNTITTIFSRNSWPFDTRSKQAYVHRFFNWLSLPPNLRRFYPTNILSASDSVAFRQCLWVDFVFGTPEAQRALEGLYKTLFEGTDDYVEVSPKTHEVFCEWVDINPADNTRRGPFARWLEDVGLGIPMPGRKSNETSILIDKFSHRYVTPESFSYSLFLEFANPLKAGRYVNISVDMDDVLGSQTMKALLIGPDKLGEKISQCIDQGYFILLKNTLFINSRKFIRSLIKNAPFPSQDWIDEDSTIDDPLTREIVEGLESFPADDCTVGEGEPFNSSVDLESTTRSVRDRSFSKRVGSAYNYRCCITNMRFRSPSKASWYGESAHIVPVKGKSRDGNEVFGKSVISNGLYLSKFIHWCFDKGWIGMEPIFKGRRLHSYKTNIATIALDEFFKEEKERLIEFNNKTINPRAFPLNRTLWPSLVALEWHKQNIFEG